jgi:hypothetical protein
LKRGEARERDTSFFSERDVELPRSILRLLGDEIHILKPLTSDTLAIGVRISTVGVATSSLSSRATFDHSVATKLEARIRYAEQRRSATPGATRISTVPEASVSRTRSCWSLPIDVSVLESRVAAGQRAAAWSLVIIHSALRQARQQYEEAKELITVTHR